MKFKSNHEISFIVVVSFVSPVMSSSLFSQVMEVVNGDALVVKTSEGQFQKIFFSSLRPPRLANLS